MQQCDCDTGVTLMPERGEIIIVKHRQPDNVKAQTNTHTQTHIMHVVTLTVYLFVVRPLSDITHAPAPNFNHHNNMPQTSSYCKPHSSLNPKTKS